jgi:hypothetical protein
MGVQPGERPDGQIGQAETAVDQQRLGQHAGSWYSPSRAWLR